MKHLFEGWDHVQTRILEAKNLFFLLDYDGTLAPIASRPELAFCPPEVRGYLEHLRDLAGVHLAIVSGRALEDLREKVGVSGIIYIGNHGLEIENPARAHRISPAPAPHHKGNGPERYPTRTVQGKHKELLSPASIEELKKITRNLRHSLRDIPGILFEEKGPTLSVHFRNVDPKFFDRIPRTLDKELRYWEGRWKMTSGKMVLDIRPNVEFHKGDAVREILKTVPSRGRLPIYLGDDQTDEDAFRALKGRGISVFIGPAGHPSEADFFLRDPDEVQQFLSLCHALLKRTDMEHRS